MVRDRNHDKLKLPMPVTTQRQVSAGGLAVRKRAGRIDVALISVGNPPRWQLPKGLVDKGETPETTAVREVREEAGIEADLVAPIETVEYWYQSKSGAQRIRYHKFVHFFLMNYRSGNVEDHDQEVNEARWVKAGEAAQLLAFANERKVLVKALEMVDNDG
jgi:8-oxo-dGTP pyrophosphatase MutT (NUDIX family)